MPSRNSDTPTDGRSSETQPGSYFVSNYPHYSYWTQDQVESFYSRLRRPADPDVPLGVYLHIPFCRRRCRFCYFKVYTDKNATEIARYVDSAIQELSLYARSPFVSGRSPRFVYFGGGTPSYLSTGQLTNLAERMQECLPWDSAEEVTLECEPGTLTEKKLRAIKDIGVTRLSLGIEHFDDAILETNGRAHRSMEIFRAYDFARSIGFPQINVDLIAGMVGETEEKWRACVAQALALDPDSVTIYQMELPHNTPISREMRANAGSVAPVADWETKRAWASYGFAEFEKAGYTVTSGYTAVKESSRARFVYRDFLWQGADLIGLGVSSFGHVGGIHYQNESEFLAYMERIEQEVIPVYRALELSPEERLIRELILQLKMGQVNRQYFRSKFDVDICDHFAQPLGSLRQAGFLVETDDGLALTREGLLRVDGLLPQFFLPRHQMAS